MTRIKRGVTTAYSVQEAQLQLYRRCYEGIAQGRYLLLQVPNRCSSPLVADSSHELGRLDNVGEHHCQKP